MINQNGSHILKINNVTLAHKGKYRLEATNNLGSEICDFELDVQSKI